jgi:uncharacterized membrane protein
MEREISSPTEEKNIYTLFRVSVILKGLISLAEVVAGLAILFVPPAIILAIATVVANSMPPGAPFAGISVRLLAEAQRYTSGTARFLSLYLVSRGVVKAFLIWALLKNKLWAYPASLLVLAGFVIYQSYQIATTHSLIVIGITLFDLVVMYFIWREYRIVKAHRAQG